MVNRSIRVSALLAALVWLSSETLAAGLGRLSVMSALGQPLKAEIELLSVPADELSAVEARLAGADAYRQARLERSTALSGLQMSVEKRPNGQPVVRISSNVPVSEPFVDLLIELNWNSGRILREYTVLLDPVREQKAEPASRPVLASATEAPVLAEPPRVQPPIAEPAKRAEMSVKQVDKPVAAASAPRTYGPVKSGETLRSIAAKVLPPDVTLDMMVASLYQANPHAFARDNLNMLKRGQVLTIPDRDAVMMMYSPSQARQLLQSHAQAWQDMHGRLAEQAARSVAEFNSAAPGKGKIVQAQPDTPHHAAPSTDVLKLSKGENAKAADASMAQRIHALEEELAAKGRALKEAQDKVSQLERTVQELQRLVELRAKVVPAPAPAAQQPAPAPVKPTPAPVKPTPAAEQPAPSAPPPPAPVEVESPGLLDSLLSNPLYLGGGLSALVLAGLGFAFVASKRRRKGLSSFEQSVMTEVDQFKTSIFKTGGETTTEKGAVTQSGTATDFSRLGHGNIDTHEVDPIAEAEVYMAYGRDAQAEEILKEALGKDPGRHEIVLKLLEIYATRQDTVSFESQASELYASLGDPTSQVWQKAAEMGRKIDPSNPLYRVFGEPAALEEAKPAQAASVAQWQPAQETEPAVDDLQELPFTEPAQELDDLEFDADFGKDFDLESASASELEDMQETGLSVDFEHPDAVEELPELQPEPMAETDLQALQGPEDEFMAEELKLDFDMPTADELDQAGGLSDLEEQALDLGSLSGLEEVKQDEEDTPDVEPEYPAFGMKPASSLAELEEIQLPDAEPEPPAEPLLELPEAFETLEPAELPDFEQNPGPSSELSPELKELMDLSGLEMPEDFAHEAPDSLSGADAVMPELDFSGIDLELHEPDEEIVAQPVQEDPGIQAPSDFDPDLLEEVNTKLDLARAYLEMGDKEGASEILDEVTKEGDTSQIQEAEKLIASL